MSWQNGRWFEAVQQYSPNCCARPDEAIVSLVVLHNISLPPFEYGSCDVKNLFLNQLDENKDSFFRQLKNLTVSSHFLIDRLGVITQFVSCDQMAYHAGVSSFQGIDKCNHYSIGIELEGCDFEPFTEQQYCVLNQLLHAIVEQYPISAITGHQHIAPNRKTDPGHFFDWDKVKIKGVSVYGS